MEVGQLSRSMHWGFPHLKQLIETKANYSGGYATTKDVNVSIQFLKTGTYSDRMPDYISSKAGAEVFCCKKV